MFLTRRFRCVQKMAALEMIKASVISRHQFRWEQDWLSRITNRNRLEHSDSANATALLVAQCYCMYGSHLLMYSIFEALLDYCKQHFHCTNCQQQSLTTQCSTTALNYVHYSRKTDDFCEDECGLSASYPRITNADIHGKNVKFFVSCTAQTETEA